MYVAVWLLLGVCGAAREALAQKTWTGAVDSQWATAGNWSPSGAPTSADDATIPAGATVTVSATSQVRNLVTDRNITIACPGNLTIAGDLTLNGTATISNTGNCAALNFLGGGSRTVFGTGSIVLSSPSADALRISSSTQFNVSPGVTIRNSGASSIRIVDAASSIVNNGTISAGISGASLVIVGGGSLENHATLRATGNSTLSLQCGWTNPSGTITVASGTMILGGTYGSIGSVSRSGGVLMLSGTCNGPSISADASTGNIVLETTTINNTAISASGGAVISVSNSVSFNNVSLQTNISVACPNSLVLRGDVAFTGGATIALAGGACTAMSTAGSSNCHLTGTGGITISTATLTVGNLATLTVGPGVSIRGIGGSSFVSISTAGSVVNQGTISVDVAGASLSISGSGQLNNQATVATHGAALLSVLCPWSNTTGTFVIENSQLKLGNTYSSLGAISRIGTSTLTLSGTFNNPGTFTAGAATGSVVFDTCTINGGSLATADGAAVNFNQTVTLNGVSVASNISISPSCNANLQVQNSLTLVGGAALSLQGGCGGTTISFVGGGSVSLGGSGSLVLGASAASPQLTVGSSTNLNIAPGITVRTSAGSNEADIICNTGAILVNQGLISSQASGRLLRIFGAGAFDNQGTIEAINGGTLDIGCVWANNGSLNINNSSFVVEGGGLPLPVLGNVTRSGGTVSLTGAFAPGGSIEATAGTGDIRLASVTLSGCTLRSSGGAKYTIDGSNTFTGVVLAADAAISNCTGAPLITVPDALTLQNGAVLSFQSCNGTLFFSGGGQRSIVGSGTLRFDGTGKITVMGGTTLTVGAGVTVCTGTSYATLEVYQGSTLINQGTLSARTAAMGVYLVNGGTFINQGVLEALAGSSLQVDCNWSNPTGSIMLTGATSIFGKTFSASSFGNFARSGGTLTLTGTFNIGGVFDASASVGPVQLQTIAISNGTLAASGGMPYTAKLGLVTFSGVTLAGNLNVETNASVVDCLNTLTLSGSPVISLLGSHPGIGIVSGAQHLAGTGSIVFDGPASIDVTTNNSLTIDAGVTVRSGSSGGTINVYPGASLVNQGLFSCQTPGALLRISGGSFLNTGIVQAIVTGARIDLSSTTLSNLTGSTISGGEWRARDGAVIVTALNAIQTIGAGASVLFAGSGSGFVSPILSSSVAGLARVDGSLSLENRVLSVTPAGGLFTVGGQLSVDPDSQLQVTGNYEQTPTGSLLSAAGHPGNSGIGRVLVSGTATIAGTLGITFVNGYVQPHCQVTQFFQAATVSGSFGVVTLPRPESRLVSSATGFSVSASSAADIASAGSSDPQSGPDGFLTGEDFDLFVLAFFTELRRTVDNTLIADLTDGTGTGGPDGFLTGTDFDSFVSGFFVGC